jgi:glutamate N-acetyltransferase/amino-acid N-acetyltransferase
VSVTAATGFVAGGLACGIKQSGAPDLAVVATDDHAPVPAAAVFTSNLEHAATVQVSRAHLADPRAAAVVLSSGNANAATGEAGRRDARRMCQLVGEGLDAFATDVLVCSTGLIGIPMPMPALEAGIPKVCGTLHADGGGDAAQAILTTDTVRKEAVAHAGSAVVGGMAKGAAMLSPAMATMLAVLTTDAAVDADVLQPALAQAVRDTFDCLSVDGCRSTNDTVIVLANGRAGAVDTGALTDALTAVCGSLAEQMARDAEGATKFVRVQVLGARTADDARVAARAVANSQLVQ